MKILIGTPIHEFKDYSMKRWLKSVSKIKVDKEIKWRLFMVDNSENQAYHQKVHRYCQELNFKNYDLLHLQGMKDGDEGQAERLGKSREIIRQRVLKENWHWWFSWECDLICPSNILQTLVDYSVDCDVVGHTYPLRGHRRSGKVPGYQELESMGIMLFSKKVFKEYGFLEGIRHNVSDGPLVHEIIGRWRWVSLHSLLPIAHLG